MLLPVSVYAKDEIWKPKNLIAKDQEIIGKFIESGDYTVEGFYKVVSSDEVNDSIPNYFADAIKMTYVMFNPQNKEFGKLPQTDMVSDQFEITSSSQSNSRLAHSFFNQSAKRHSDEVSLDPFLAFKDSSNNFVLICRLNNDSGRLLKVDGVDYLAVQKDGKTIAEGEGKAFSEPMIYSSRPENAKVNKGIYDGYPTYSWVAFKFAPGSYDPSIDVDDMGGITVLYSIQYEDANN